jgi:ABC-2 type transport system permease protein
VENQGYLHYNKGALVMDALREYVGEEKLNAALAAFLRDYKFQRPPFVCSCATWAPPCPTRCAT